ncbi:MAG: SIS domain-containing protein [Burkholderiaceae bacterium]|jgi:D-sedoheptulose 7-phosphate isomerase|nr:SIS domain-containing protein [Burkholderiaceae bacterium]
MLEQQIEQHFIESADLNYQTGPALAKPIAQATQALLTCVTGGGKVLACGSGVSGLLAAQFAAYFVDGFERERPGLAAIALTSEAADQTADTPDTVQSERFARNVYALGQAGDVLLVLGVNGQNTALAAAIQAAHERDMSIIALLGNAHKGTLAQCLRETDVQMSVAHERAMRVHEIHQLILHCLCDGVDLLLLGEPEGNGVRTAEGSA